MSARVLLVTFDSAEPQLAREWADQGYLPTLKRLLSLGHLRDIENLPGFGNGVFWPSIYTGTDPSFHGGYYLRQPRPPTYSLEPFGKYDYVLPPFWKLLEDQGLRVAVIDPVESPFGGLSRGVEVFDWKVHRRDGLPQSSPPGLIKTLLTRYGDDPFEGNIDRTVKVRTTPEGLSELSEHRIRSKTEAALEILGQREWDLFMLSFADPHDIGHAAWHLHDLDPAQRPQGESRCPGGDDPLRLCYQRLDTALAELMKSAGEGAQTIVVMGPGMERNVSANSVLPDILRAFQGRPRRGMKRWVSQASRAVARSEWIPWGIRKRLRTHRTRIGARTQAKAGCRYFTVPHNDNAAAVRINVLGRDEHGVVPGGKAYEELCEELSQRLLALRDATRCTGAVSEVIKVHEHYHGAEIDRLPDLLVVWNRNADLSAVGSDDIGFFHKAIESHRTGDHSQRGLVLSDRAIALAPASPIGPTQVTPILVDAARACAGSKSSVE